jgi:hypothetical protein
VGLCGSDAAEEFGGRDRGRTGDLIVANDALSQLSYSPTKQRTEGILAEDWGRGQCGARNGVRALNFLAWSANEEVKGTTPN